MKKYTYQILRYMPDRVSGEFVNVGLVFFSQENKYLRAAALTKIGRVKSLFPGVHSKALIRKLKTVTNNINQKNKKWQEELEIDHYSSLKSATKEILPQDDSSIILSKSFTGVDLNFDNAFEDLFNRLVLQHDQKSEKYLTDKEAVSYTHLTLPTKA